MIKAVRQKKIYELLSHLSVLSVRDLSSEFAVADSTIRRDLEEMERRGELRRTYGGAVIIDTAEAEMPFVQRAVTNLGKKTAIGQVACSFVQDGDTVFIDGGTTTEQMIPCLTKKKRLTVITCGLNIANRLTQCPEIDTIVTGGFLDPESMTVIPIFDDEKSSYERINISKIFFSCAGISADAGITNRIVGRISTKKKLLETASDRILLVDGSKVGADAAIVFAPVTTITHMITDDSAPEEEIAKIRAKGVKVTIVSLVRD
jgi:DeoR/GlpR family transcriptional regulator of sugar metabolism